MKTYLIAFLAFVVLGIGVSSCKKDNIYGDSKNLVLGSYLTLLGTGNSTIDYKGIDTSTVSLTVGQYGSPIASVNIYARLGGITNDITMWKFVKSVPFTGEGTVLTVTGAEMIAALGIAAADVNTDITLFNEAVTTDGRKFSYANTPDSYYSFTVYNMAFVWTASLINYICPYEQSYFDGTFNVVSDEWNDYATGDGVTVSPGPGANQITISLYPATGVGTNRKPIVANVDPATDSLTIPKQTYGDYSGDYIAAEGVGYLSACSGIISLTLDHTDVASGDDYGIYNVILQKP